MSAAWLWELVVSSLFEMSLWWELLMSKVELLVGLERQVAWLLERHCSFGCAFEVMVEKKGMAPYIYSVLKHCNMGSCRR